MTCWDGSGVFFSFSVNQFLPRASSSSPTDFRSSWKPDDKLMMSVETRQRKTGHELKCRVGGRLHKEIEERNGEMFFIFTPFYVCKSFMSSLFGNSTLQPWFRDLSRCHSTLSFSFPECERLLMDRKAVQKHSAGPLSFSSYRWSFSNLHTGVCWL